MAVGIIKNSEKKLGAVSQSSFPNGKHPNLGYNYNQNHKGNYHIR